jgi:hypothetical protein
MSETESIVDMHFIQLVLSLQTGAMVQLGKIASPMSGKVERDLEQARLTIDLLEMLDRKTAGNLVGEERKLLDRILYELRLNFVDELGKGQQSADEKEVNPGSPPVDNQDTESHES